MAAVGDLVIEAVTERGPTLLLPGGAVESDDEKRAAEICVAYGAKTAAATVKVALRVNDSYRELEVTVKERDEFVGWLAEERWLSLLTSGSGHNGEDNC